MAADRGRTLFQLIALAGVGVALIQCHTGLSGSTDLSGNDNLVTVTPRASTWPSDPVSSTKLESSADAPTDETAIAAPAVLFNVDESEAKIAFVAPTSIRGSGPIDRSERPDFEVRSRRQGGVSLAEFTRVRDLENVRWREPRIRIARTDTEEVPPAEQALETFDLNIDEVEIGQVLKMLGEISGANVLAGPDVKGTVTANLKGVTIDEALDAIGRSLGLAFERDDRFLYVLSPAEAEARRKVKRKLMRKVYRPMYISVKDLQSLVVPLQTPEVGIAATTNPSEVGLRADSENAGGDSYVQPDALLVIDYPEVIEQIDWVVESVDVPPLQVVIEAVLLSVRLTDELEFGVNFALLNDTSQMLTVSGNGQVLDASVGFPGTSDTILPPTGRMIADVAGLKSGLIRGDISLFIEALERISDTNLIAAPQLRVLNKQRAQLIIGDRLGYITVTNNGTTSQENANFLEVGTKLIIRPFISPDGWIRLEVHPERSSGAINETTGLPDTQTTEVTTNVMVRDGMTIAIGGLIEEQVVESVRRVPLLGSLPVVGPAFREKTERVDRSELIVLITPRIVNLYDESGEDELYRHENDARREHFRRNLAPVNRQNLAEMHKSRARRFLRDDQLTRARYHIRKALQDDKNDLEALRISQQIEQALRERTRFPWTKSKKKDPLPADVPALEPPATTTDTQDSGALPPVPPDPIE